MLSFKGLARKESHSYTKIFLMKINLIIGLAKRVYHFLAIPVCIMIVLSAFTTGNLPDNPADNLATKKGAASFYHNSFQGRKTATGEIFSQQKLTCASNVYPLGTWLRVTNEKNGKSFVVKVNDRMHPKMKRLVDLSRMAAEELGMIKTGVAKVEIENLGKKYKSN
jgi:rare lipoprotein A